ncbi:DUF3304 domain-containing protein [Duganella sp. BJB1802]|uniref:DUF3304 domain-containing protein n=1 Tax=Duganella sp. BJB1802 TaxID=2744575 RepID=UPI001593365E|nr:DUF3304 domain-containing protein [Duganella sp. BJB1802]NVD71789.1 DUF3304 domain-containing protein [Duganella sp. BJB1802]
MKKFFVLIFYLTVAVTWLGACGNGVASPGGEVHKRDMPNGAPISLSLSGYNYTNQSIDSFSVNGQGGGNIFVSTPTSGGGGTACCVTYFPNGVLKKVTVRWQSGGCYFHRFLTKSNEVFDTFYPYYKEADVSISEDVAKDPKRMEVHFYPDGTVQVHITDEASEPRLSLPPSREDLRKLPRCSHDKKPE